MGSIWLSGARVVRNALTEAVEGVRAVLFMILGLAARHLPRAWAYALADAVQWLLAASPIGGRARRMMGDTFASQREETAKLAGEWLGRPFRDHVNAVRIATGREHMRDWTVEMRNAPSLLDDPSQSFIIATGHFSRAAMGVLYMPSLLRRRLATVVAPMTASRTWRGLRVRLQMREIRKGIEVARDGDVYIADVTGKAFLVKLLNHLRAPGGAVIIATDAAWHGDKVASHSRPFAAFAMQSFALGAARLARLSQRPIVVCVPFFDGDRRVVTEWGPVIAPPARDDAAADARITDEILDWIERRIGARPGQYVQSFGQGRRWSRVAQCWVRADEGLALPVARNHQRSLSTEKSES